MLGDEELQFIQLKLEENPCYTISDLKEMLREEQEISVSDSTITRATKHIHFTLKRILLVSEARNAVRTTELRREWVIRASAEPQDAMVFCDEAGFNLHTRCLFGRSKRGTPATLEVPANRGRNVSLCAAIGVGGVLHYAIQVGAFNTQLYVEFLRDLLAVLDQDARQRSFLLVMDNVRFHHSAAVQDLVAASSHRISYLPPYSPFLNPIENCFSKWKNSVRRSKFKTRETLIERIGEAAALITEENCLGWYQNARN
jgi:transposase